MSARRRLTMPSPKKMGEVLRELRERKGFTQAALAERAQVALSYVTLIESGHDPRTPRQIIQRLARALGVPAKQLDPDA